MKDAPLKELISGDLSDDAVLAEALRQLRRHPVISQARAEVQRRADLAREQLAILPEGEAKDALLQICSELVNRAS